MFTASEVAAHHQTDPRNVRNHVRRGGKPGTWAQYVVPGTYDFVEMPPPYVAKPVPKRFQKKVRPVMMTDPLPAALAQALGSLYTPAQCLMKPGTMPEPPADYTERLPWALYWAERGLAVQPAEFLLGTVIYGSTADLRKPTTKLDVVERMWFEENVGDQGTDIACWPDAAHMFVIEVHQDCVEGPDFDLEEGALIINYAALGARRYWYPGRCYTKLHALGRWVHVIGIGRHSYLPPSAVPGYAR